MKRGGFKWLALLKHPLLLLRITSWIQAISTNLNRLYSRVSMIASCMPVWYCFLIAMYFCQVWKVLVCKSYRASLTMSTLLTYSSIHMLPSLHISRNTCAKYSRLWPGGRQHVHQGLIVWAHQWRRGNISTCQTASWSSDISTLETPKQVA